MHYSTKVKVRTRLQHDKNSTKPHDGNMTPSERRAGEKSEKRMCVEPMPSDDESWSLISNNSLSWSDHIDDVFTKCARHVGILNSLRKKLSKRCLTRIYKGYIRPRLEYACAVWSGGNTSKLLKLQQKFCRQHQVQLPNLSNRFKFHTLTLFYKIRNGLAPTYLSEILPESFVKWS